MNKLSVGIASFLAGAVIVGSIVFGVAHTSNVGISQPASTITPNYAQALGSKTQGVFTLGPSLASTSTLTSTVSLPRGLTYGLNLGDTCAVQLSSATSSLGFSEDAQITAIATGTASATVTFFNGAGSAVTIATGTLKVVCNNY